MDEDNVTRVENEYALLQAMYPEEVTYNYKTNELQYIHAGASLLLRIPDGYPQTEAPQIISATGSDKTDLRDKLKAAADSLSAGEEAIDAIIDAFQGLLEKTVQEEVRKQDSTKQSSTKSSQNAATKQTTIIWLHHLLNTNKRKLALSPDDGAVSGISKPGYPGVLIFSGPATAVLEHVNLLKQQNWAAFQVRYDEECEWIFDHGAGVKEVETMGKVVDEVGVRKDDFLEAMRMR